MLARAPTHEVMQEQSEDVPSSKIGGKVKEMELQAHVIRLEKEMESTRNRLFDVRRQNYQQ